MPHRRSFLLWMMSVYVFGLVGCAADSMKSSSGTPPPPPIAQAEGASGQSPSGEVQERAVQRLQPATGAPSSTIGQPQAMAPVAPLSPTTTRYYIYDVGPVVLPTGALFRLNQSGQMIWNSSGHAYMYQSCESRDLGHLGGGQSIATAINSAGVIVGKSAQAGGRWRAFAYSNGAMRDLGGSTNQGIQESATAINFWGDVVGVESASGGLAPQAVRYADGAASMMARILLHPPAGWGSIQDVVDLNDSKSILGSLMDSGVNVAFRSDNFGNLWTRIAGVPGFESTGTTPRAMNRYGQVVGVAGNGFVRAEQTNGGGPRAFVHDGTHMIDLNTVLWNGAGWLLREANAINDAGQIVGEGLFNNQTHAFFLQPMARAPLPEAIPCPPRAMAQ